MTVDLYSTMLWADGAQVDPAGLNNSQRFIRAQLMDQLLASTLSGIALSVSSGSTILTSEPTLGGLNGADIPSIFAYTLAAGSSFLRQGSANSKIQLAPGALLQKIANADGNEATLVPFRFAGTEEWTLTNGDATSPRVDVLQMKLQYIDDTPASVDFQDAVTRAITTNASASTRHRVQCTLSVKVGTPAASPTIPDPDAGFVAVGTVVVGHGWTTGGNAPIFGLDSAEANNVVVHDQRMPLGVHAYRVDPVLYKISAAWTLGTANQFLTSGGAGTNLAFAGCQNRPGRLICIDARTAIAAATSQRIGAFTTNLGGLPNTGVQLVGNQSGGAIGAGALGDTWRSTRTQFEAVHAPGAGPTIQQSAVNKIGMPIWSTGYRTPNLPIGVGPSYIGMSWNNITAGNTLGETVFYLADGL